MPITLDTSPNFGTPDVGAQQSGNNAIAVAQAAAADVSTSAGNLWSDVETGTNTYDPLVLDPGQAGTISVQITPSDNPGTKVKGFLALESFNFNTLSSDEAASFPYSYRVAKGH